MPLQSLWFDRIDAYSAHTMHTSCDFLISKHRSVALERFIEKLCTIFTSFYFCLACNYDDVGWTENSCKCFLFRIGNRTKHTQQKNQIDSKLKMNKCSYSLCCRVYEMRFHCYSQYYIIISLWIHKRYIEIHFFLHSVKAFAKRRISFSTFSVVLFLFLCCCCRCFILEFARLLSTVKSC